MTENKRKSTFESCVWFMPWAENKWIIGSPGESISNAMEVRLAEQVSAGYCGAAKHTQILCLKINHTIFCEK